VGDRSDQDCVVSQSARSYKFRKHIGVVQEFKVWTIEPVLRVATLTQGIGGGNEIGRRLPYRQGDARSIALGPGRGGPRSGSSSSTYDGSGSASHA